MSTAKSSHAAQDVRRVLVMACLGVFVAYAPVTSVSVSLPAVQQALDASTAQLQWVADAFVLPMAAFIMTAGVLGDAYGRARVYRAGLLCSAVGAGVALCATSVPFVWLGQAVAGTGAAALLPTTLAMIGEAVPDPRERGRYVGIWAASLSGALASGPLVAGLILDRFSWRWIYLPVLLAALAALAVSARIPAATRPATRRRLDWPGQLSAMLTVTALVYGVIEGGAEGFTHARSYGPLLLSAVSAVAFVLVEWRTESPMLDLRLFRSPGFTGATVVAMITFLGLIGFFFVMSLYYGVVQQLSTLEAGVRMVLVSGMSLLLSPLVGRLTRRVSARVMIACGLTAAAAALLTLTRIDADTSLTALSWPLMLLGTGLAFVITPMTATAVGSVPPRMAGMASAGSNAFRQLGTALGPALLGALLSSRAKDTLPGHLTDAETAPSTLRYVVGVADSDGLHAVAGLPLDNVERGRVLRALSESYLDGLHVCLVVSASLLLLAALTAIVLLRKPPHGATTVVAAPVRSSRPAAEEAAS